MHAFGLMSSPQVVSAFDLSHYQTLVDLGGGTGHLAVAACARYPRLRAILFDLAEVGPLASELIGTAPVASRINIVAGDFFVDPLPDADLFAVSRILHDWAEEKILQLLEKVYKRLPTGGALLIAEKLLLDDKSGPVQAQMQSLNMLTCTEGKERTLSEYESLLKRVGFNGAQGCRLSGPLDAIIASKS
jgi:acetylserotonin N-methyltransferase